MENKEGYLEFISSESYKHQLDIWYRAYNISREKTELFYDFIISLYDLVESTFLGSEVYENDLDCKNHYDWCWDKIVDNFENERIFFKYRGNCHEYFWNFFHEAFYLSQQNGNQSKIKEYFIKLFNFNLKKTRSELDMLSEIYKLFDQNLKK